MQGVVIPKKLEDEVVIQSVVTVRFDQISTNVINKLKRALPMLSSVSHGYSSKPMAYLELFGQVLPISRYGIHALQLQLLTDEQKQSIDGRANLLGLSLRISGNTVDFVHAGLIANDWNTYRQRQQQMYEVFRNEVSSFGDDVVLSLLNPHQKVFYDKLMAALTARLPFTFNATSGEVLS